MARDGQKGGMSSYDKGAVRVFACNIFHHITIVYIQIVHETFQYNNLVKYDTYSKENYPLKADFKGLFLGIHEKMGL